MTRTRANILTAVALVLILYPTRHLAAARWKDLLRDIHWWQIESAGGMTLVFVLALMLAVCLAVVWVLRVREAIRKRNGA